MMMDKQQTVLVFNKTLVDLLDNFSNAFPGSGLYKYKMFVSMNNSEKWINEFSKTIVHSKEELFECNNLDSLGLSDLNLNDKHKNIIWKYFKILNQLYQNYNIA